MYAFTHLMECLLSSSFVSHSVRCVSKKVIYSIIPFMVMIKSNERMLFIQWVRGVGEVTSMITAHQKTSED